MKSKSKNDPFDYSYVNTNEKENKPFDNKK